jgi:hypothetical protein
VREKRHRSEGERRGAGAVSAQVLQFVRFFHCGLWGRSSEVLSRQILSSGGARNVTQDLAYPWVVPTALCRQF